MSNKFIADTITEKLYFTFKIKDNYDNRYHPDVYPFISRNKFRIIIPQIWLEYLDRHYYQHFIVKLYFGT